MISLQVKKGKKHRSTVIYVGNENDDDMKHLQEDFNQSESFVIPTDGSTNEGYPTVHSDEESAHHESVSQHSRRSSGKRSKNTVNNNNTFTIKLSDKGIL